MGGGVAEVAPTNVKNREGACGGSAGGQPIGKIAPNESADILHVGLDPRLITISSTTH